LKRGWQYSGIAFAILFALWAQQAWTLSLTDALGPGPGFFPFFLALIGVALALIVAMRAGSSVQPTAHNEPVLPRGRALRTVCILLAALVAVALLLELLGFRATIAAFCLLLLPVLGARNPWVIAAFAGAASFGVYALFSDLLKVPLPAGVFGP
jgi:putative tricarboxylic transport membrane protein